MGGWNLHISGPTGQRVQPVQDSASIGRAVENSIRLDDPTVSRKHAVLRRAGDRWQIEDLNTRAGTLLNGARVSSAELRVGDVIAISHWRLTLAPHTEPERGTIVASESVDGEVAFPPARELKEPAALQATYEKLRLTWALEQKIAAEEDPTRVFALVARFCLDVLPTDAVEIRAREGGELLPTVSRQRGTVSPVTVSTTVIDRVARRREALLLHDIDLHGSLAGAASLMGVQSVLAAPIVVEGEVEAVLVCESRTHQEPFDDADLQLVTSIARHAGASMARMALGRRLRDEAITRAHLSRFLSPGLVDRVHRHELDLRPGGVRLPAVVLFSDIRGYTSFSEREGPERTVAVLNAYLDAMVDVVFHHGGNLDKFGGDSIMATWGAPEPRPDDPERAMRCALGMMRRLEKFNAERPGEPPIQVGIGLCGGPVIVGLIGSNRRHDYTMIGDAVNVASRLCSVAGPGEILAHADLAARAATTVHEARPPIAVKGKREPIPICRVVGLVTD